MKAVILAGGFGTRLAELTETIPKPMVPIGKHPILWHVMSIYAASGITEFAIACGYKGEVIKKYFNDFRMSNSDYTIDLESGEKEVLDTKAPGWKVSLVDTGLHTMTGGRVLRLKPMLDSGTFMVTYGDGVGNIPIDQILEFHRSHGKFATVTAVRPPARFGGLDLDGDRVNAFTEKPQAGGGWINGGFFIFEPALFDYLEGDETILERDPLEDLANDGELMAFRHNGFWQPMDTLREKRMLQDMWESGDAPWVTW